MPAAKPVKIDKPIKFDAAMRKLMSIPPLPKKSKPKKSGRKKQRKS